MPVVALLVGGVLAASARPPSLPAQGAELGRACAAAADVASCAAAAQALTLVAPRLALVAAAGSPVPGTANTLGMRFGPLPRWTAALRATGTRLDDVPRLGPLDETAAGTAFAVAVDGSLGIYQGKSVAPGMAGLGAVDALASLGTVFAPSSDGFENRASLAWGVGMRVGLFRESFQLPAVSVSALYRRLGTFRYEGTAAAWRAQPSAVSLRAGASKHVAGFALGLGGGLDRIGIDAAWRDPDAAAGEPGGALALDDVVDTRLMAHGSVAWTLIILQGVLEGGWQQGGEEVADAPDALRGEAGEGAWFASLALRLVL